MACRPPADWAWASTAWPCWSPTSTTSETLFCSLSCGAVARPMLNPELLRREPEKTRAVLARRDQDAVEAFDKAVVADDAWRAATAEVEALRAERKQRASSRRGRPCEEEVLEERRLGEQLAELERKLKVLEDARNDAIAWVPNLPDESVP